MEHGILERLTEAIIDRQFKSTEGLARDALEQGLGPLDILNGALLPAIDVVGKDFKEHKIFLPELLMSVRAYENAFKLIQPLLAQGDYRSKGKIVIGTVAGDLHDIGKNIVGSLIQGNGFEIIDLGVDVKRERFLQAALENEAEVIAMSALLTTSMPEMKSVMEDMEKQGMRQKFRVMIGGAPVSQAYAKEIGADGYAEDAQEAVDLVKELVKK